jgi:hypothetical protein
MLAGQGTLVPSAASGSEGQHVEVGKSPEVRVESDHAETARQGKRGQIGIGPECRADGESAAQAPKLIVDPGRLIQKHDLRRGQPALIGVPGFPPGQHRVAHDVGVGEMPEQGQGRDPAKRHLLGGFALPVAPGALVVDVVRRRERHPDASIQEAVSCFRAKFGAGRSVRDALPSRARRPISDRLWTRPLLGAGIAPTGQPNRASQLRRGVIRPRHQLIVR